MDSQHHDHHQSGGIWNLLALLLGIALAIFALVAGASFIIKGASLSRAHGPAPAPEVAASASAPAAAPAAPAPAASPAAAAPAATTPAAVPAPAAPAPVAPTPAPAAPAPAASAPAAGAVNGEIVIKPGADNPLTYDVKQFIVKSGSKVRITFNNQSALPQPHNLIVGKMGSKDRLMAAFATMVTDPNGMAKGYIPESADIIAHTKLLNPGSSETIEFAAPAEKGDYPYICSFPGHGILMNGVMKVE